VNAHVRERWRTAPLILKLGKKDEGEYVVNNKPLPVLKMVHALAQLVEALRYKSEDRGFDSRWCHWNFSFT
jgi:hypothetical protein